MSARLRGAALAFLLALGAGPAWTQPQDDGAAEIALWHAVLARGSRADYEGYLLLFPNGRFAPLARVRLEAAPNDPGQPAPRPPPAGPGLPPLPPELELYHLDVTPPVAAAGQSVVVRPRGLLPAAMFDLIIVVPAGTPDVTASGTLDERAVLVKGLAHLFDLKAGVLIPPLPAGAYEVRYVSRQYNPEGRLETMARAGIVWR